MCRFHGYPFLRLDGSTGVGKRQKLVDLFNDPTSRQVLLAGPLGPVLFPNPHRKVSKWKKPGIAIF